MSLGAVTGSRRAQIALVAVGVAAYALAAWFLFVSPKRAEASRLRQDVAAAEEQVAGARHTPGSTPAPADARASDLFRLAEAMPASSDQASLLLELDALAERAKVTTGAVTLQDPSVLSEGTTVVPISVTVTGTYRQILRYLAEMRRLVGLKGDRPHVVGRLLTVQSVDLAESKASGFPQLDASILLNAHVYDGPMAAPTPITPPTETTTSQGTPTAAGATP